MSFLVVMVMVTVMKLVFLHGCAYMGCAFASG